MRYLGESDPPPRAGRQLSGWDRTRAGLRRLAARPQPAQTRTRGVALERPLGAGRGPAAARWMRGASVDRHHRSKTGRTGAAESRRALALRVGGCRPRRLGLGPRARDVRVAVVAGDARLRRG